MRQDVLDLLTVLIWDAWTSEAPTMRPDSKLIGDQARTIASNYELEKFDPEDFTELFRRASNRIYSTQVEGRNFRAYFVPIPGLQGLIYESKLQDFKDWRNKRLGLDKNRQKPKRPEKDEAAEIRGELSRFCQLYNGGNQNPTHCLQMIAFYATAAKEKKFLSSEEIRAILEGYSVPIDATLALAQELAAKRLQEAQAAAGPPGGNE